jgi:hypothetical protein
MMLTPCLLFTLSFASADPATELAASVKKTAGGEELSKVAELRFKFVVYEKGEKKMLAEHRWDLVHSRDRVMWTDRKGTKRDGIVDLQTKKADGTVDGKKPEDAAQKELGEKTYARWVNDSYWLMLPLKVLDPGVRREMEPQRDVKGKKYDVLKLSFENVGLTPGDVYWLYVDPETKEIARWEMQLQGQKGPPEGTTFEDYRKIGPLKLALNHVTSDGNERIVLEDVQVLTKVEDGDFRL